MKPLYAAAASLFVACCALAHAGDGILSRSSNNERTAATEILIMNGKAYVAPAGTAASIQQQQEQQEQQGAVNPRTGQYLAPAGNGIVVYPRTGNAYKDADAGYANTQNGQFVSK